MKINLKLSGLLVLLFCMMGCKSVDGTRFSTNEISQKSSLTNTWHDYRVIPQPNTTNITTLDKLNPVWWFKNIDDTEIPNWHRPGKKFRGFTWFSRNPFHNFTFFVIGIADKEHVRSGKYPESIWNPQGGMNFSVARYKYLRLPLVSYRGKKVESYIGWRVRGNFGLKFNIKKKKELYEKGSGLTNTTGLISPSEAGQF